MNFKIEKTALLNCLNVSQKAMAAKSNMPALTGILITCKDGKVVLNTSNTDISIKVEVEHASLEIINDGTCLVPGRLFCDIIRKLGGDEVEIELEDDNILRIQGGSSDITLNLLDVEDYPTQKYNEEGTPIVLKANLLKELIRETVFATSVVENRPILTGVNIKISENKLLAVATDSFRLSRRNADLESDYLETNIIIPAKSLNELNKIIGDDTNEVNIYLTQAKALFSFGNISFQTRLLEGNYPDTTKLIPTSFPIILKFNKFDLIESIDRVSTLSSNPNTTPIVKLQIEPNGTVNLVSNSPELGTIKDTIAPAEIVSMGELSISFSATYFLDALRAFNSEEICVKFTGLNKQFILEAEHDEGLVELVLPIKAE